MATRTRLYRWMSSWRAYLGYRQAHSKQERTNNDSRSFKSFMKNTTASCVLYAAGDTISQRLEGHGEMSSNDWSRTGRMAVIGAFIGVIDTVWYTKLDEMFPGVKVRPTAKKVLLDQLIWSPVCCITFFFGMSSLEGNSVNEGLNEIKVKFWPTYTIDWLLWPPAQAINFLFVPPKYRVICVAFITFLWTIILSYMKHKKITGKDTVLKSS